MMVKQLLKMFIGLITVLIFFELTIRFLSHHSPKIRFFSSSPYQQQYLSNIFNWKDLLTLYCCQFPGSEINGFIFNSHGFETPDVQYQKPSGTKRLVLIGDSQSVGYVPYHDHFSRLTEKRVNDSQPNFQVINLGVLGFGPLMELKVLEMEGLLYQPDIVMLTFFVGNDFYDDTIYSQRYKETRHKMPLWTYQSRLFSFLRNNIRFRIVKYFSSNKDKTSQQFCVNIGKTDYDESLPTFSKEQYFYLESERAEIIVKNSKLYDHLDLVTKSILTMKSLTEQVNAKFIVLVIPDEFQVNPNLFSEIINKKPTNTSVINSMIKYIYRPNITERNWSNTDYDIKLPQKILKDFFIENHINYIDLLEEWDDNPDAAGYYLPQDTHLNRKGNQSVSDIVTPVISDLLNEQANTKH